MLPSLGLLLLATVSLQQDDWPTFLGPQGTSSIELTEASPWSWPEGGPEITWRTPVEPGYGGAAIKDGQIFILDRIQGEGDQLRVFSLEDGRELWNQTYDAPGRVSFPGTRCVPAVGEDFVVTLGPMGHVNCVSRSTHESVWRLALIDDQGGALPRFGYASSPLILDGYVVVPVLGEETGLLALDLETGDVRWKTPSIGFSHSSPLSMQLLGQDWIVMVTAPEAATGNPEPAPSIFLGFDPQTGKEEWRLDLTLTRLPIPAPARIDDQRVFLTGGYRSGSVMLQLSRNDQGAVAMTELWRSPRGAQVHTPILFEDHLYLIANENSNDRRDQRREGGMMCLNLEGEELWRTGDDPYLGRGGMVRVGNRLVSQDGLNGTLRMITATPASYQLLGEANVLEIGDRRDHNIWAPLAVSGTRLISRTQDELICFEFAPKGL